MKRLNRAHWDGFWAGWVGGLSVYWLIKGMFLMGFIGVALCVLLLYIARQMQKI